MTLRKLCRSALAAALLPLAAMAQPAPAPQPCPAEVPAGARCFTGEDGEGAFYWIALPAGWTRETGVLVMHAHGGPADTGPATLERSEEDLRRWAITVKAGHAWAGSSYRRGGFGVTMAADDTERLRRLFVRHFGQPRRTILHGQSYGAGVAAKAAELYRGGVLGRTPYDGVLLTSGVLGGGTRAYDVRLDLRVVYQYLCNNHPLPTEPQYPLWMGLPLDSPLTRAELARRVNDCTGLRLPAAQRSEAQRTRLATLVDVLKIPESQLLGHLNWATWLFRDLTQLRLGGRNPFGNLGVAYKGSPDDAALNAGVLRYAADREALVELARDSDPTGAIDVPVLAIHGIGDAIAFVELESAYRAIVERAGRGHLLVQTFADEREHSYLGDAYYPALFTALLDWIDRGEKPTPQAVQARCGPGCRLRPEYQPPPLDSRVPARRK